MAKTIVKYEDRYGNVFVQKVAVRHPLIEEVKASLAGCVLKSGKLYVCYNHPYRPILLGLRLVKVQ